jgi:hypothetical protein
MEKAVDQGISQTNELVAHLKALQDKNLSPMTSGLVNYRGDSEKIDAKDK